MVCMRVGVFLFLEIIQYYEYCGLCRLQNWSLFEDKGFRIKCCLDWLPPAFDKHNGLFFFQNWSKFIWLVFVTDWNLLCVLSGAAQHSSHHVKSPHRPTDDCPISLANMSRYVLLLLCGGRKSPGKRFYEKSLRALLVTTDQIFLKLQIGINFEA